MRTSPAHLGCPVLKSQLLAHDSWGVAWICLSAVDILRQWVGRLLRGIRLVFIAHGLLYSPNTVRCFAQHVIILPGASRLCNGITVWQLHRRYRSSAQCRHWWRPGLGQAFKGFKCHEPHRVPPRCAKWFLVPPLLPAVAANLANGYHGAQHHDMLCCIIVELQVGCGCICHDWLHQAGCTAADMWAHSRGLFCGPC